MGANICDLSRYMGTPDETWYIEMSTGFYLPLPGCLYRGPKEPFLSMVLHEEYVYSSYFPTADIKAAVPWSCFLSNLYRVSLARGHFSPAHYSECSAALLLSFVPTCSDTPQSWDAANWAWLPWDWPHSRNLLWVTLPCQLVLRMVHGWSNEQKLEFCYLQQALGSQPDNGEDFISSGPYIFKLFLIVRRILVRCQGCKRY